MNWKNIFVHVFQAWSKPTSSGGQEINLGLIVPHSIYNEREYNKAVSKSLAELQKQKRKKFSKFVERFSFAHSQVHRIMMKVNPSPTGKLKRVLQYYRQNAKNVSSLNNN